MAATAAAGIGAAAAAGIGAAAAAAAAEVTTLVFVATLGGACNTSSCPRTKPGAFVFGKCTGDKTAAEARSPGATAQVDSEESCWR